MATNLEQSNWIIELLLEKGVEHFVISPGSRSTPLTVAASRHPDVQTHVHFDERSAGFFALGLAKAGRKPAVLICTSGTAVANYFPAIVEAAMDNIPLLVLTADRPPELIGVGANQTIEQREIYGSYVRGFFNLVPPTEETVQSEIIEITQKAFNLSMGTPKGPAHINIQFREPLLSDQHGPESPQFVAWERGTDDSPSYQKNGIIIVGRSVRPEDELRILDLAEKTNWPVFPDVQSSLRYLYHPNVISHQDLIWINPEAEALESRLILHFGGPYTSKRLLLAMGKRHGPHVVVNENMEMLDPNNQAPDIRHTSIESYFDTAWFTGNPDQEWLEKWQALEKNVMEKLETFMSEAELISEPWLAYKVSELLPADHHLYLGNSMVIRDMEMFGQTREQPITVVGNRGASGIDGLISTAAGYASGQGKPLTLILGDLSTLHDLNALALLKKVHRPLVLIIINNRGGGIFHFLPIRNEEDIFEPYFGTPHDVEFENVSRMFGLPYSQPADQHTFINAYREACAFQGASIIEVRTDREKNHALHGQILKNLTES